MSNIQKDLVVIGGGPAGYIAAIKAARLGASVLLAEKKRVGGTCLNEGCIPTKYYVQSQHTISALTNAASRGITISDATFTIDMGQAVKGKNRTVTKLVKGVEYLLKEAKVETVNQKATIIGEHSVQLEDGRVVEAKHILITSGSIPARIPVEGIDSPLVIDSEKILDLEYLPKRLVVIGGGVIGVEFASIFNAFGSEVTIVEALPSLLQNFDNEQIDLITKSLKRKGVTIYTGTTVNKVETLKDEAKLTLSDGQIVSGDLVLLATGRVPNLSPLSDRCKIETERKHIVIDRYGATNIPTIYAAGDVTAKSMLAHAAYHMGEVVAHNICFNLGLLTGAKREIKLDIIPSVVYSDLELASVGMSEQAAKATQKYDIVVGKFPLSANGRALSADYGEGFVKVISEKKYGQILGVACVGYNVSEIIGEAVVAMQHELTVYEVAESIHAHPTINEALKEAAAICIGECYHWGS